jgi:pyruvate/2-oxoglutarate dehydrogenase complex dihydrolipoamide dehydrogenase (E3) component
VTKFDFDIGILGGGAAGLTIASGAAQFGARTLLIEKEGRLGGDCLHYGCVPSKTLIRSAGVFHLMKNADRFGLPRPAAASVDFRDIAARISSVINTIQKHDSVERFCSLGVKVLFGDPVFADEHSVRLGGATYTARSWVIATGSSAAVPKIEGLQEAPYLTNRDIFSLDRLPSSLIILGGGPVGVEMAQAFGRLGTQVTLVHRGDQILRNEDRDMAGLVMEALMAEGVSFHLDSSVLSARAQDGQKQVVFRNGSGRETVLAAEAILVATGRKPNIENLGLGAISVDHGERGLLVDSRLRTSHKHIYAAGDTTGSHLFTHAAGYEGGIVLSNAILHLPRKVDYTFLPWCTYTDPELASIGMNERRAAAAGIPYSVWTEEFRANDRSLAEGCEAGRIKLVVDGRERPLGVQIAGPRAGDLISEWVAMLNGGIRLSTLASAVHPYPTLSEINKKVAGNLFSGKVFSERVRKALRLFFRLRGRAC